VFRREPLKINHAIGSVKRKDPAHGCDRVRVEPVWLFMNDVERHPPSLKLRRTAAALAEAGQPPRRRSSRGLKPAFDTEVEDRRDKTPA
jgi:hypothetical protein